METMWKPITYYSPGVVRRLRPLYLPSPGDPLPGTPSIYQTLTRTLKRQVP
jgi:hypothetical protein